jgi:hypothetical protein
MGSRIECARRVGGAAGAAAFLALGTQASAATVDITKLQDVAFTNLNPTVDATRTQNVCVFSNTITRGYNVTARGSGAGSAFTLTAGGSIPVLAYSVQWSPSSGSSGGTSLSPGVRLTGQTSGAIETTCLLGIAASATLIVVLRSTDLQGAASGVSYTGSLSLTIAPE